MPTTMVKGKQYAENASLTERFVNAVGLKIWEDT